MSNPEKVPPAVKASFLRVGPLSRATEFVDNVYDARTVAIRNYIEQFVFLQGDGVSSKELGGAFSALAIAFELINDEAISKKLTWREILQEVITIFAAAYLEQSEKELIERIPREHR